MGAFFIRGKKGKKMAVKTYAEALAFIHGRRKFTKDPSLERMRRFAHYLGDPQKKTRFVHVTGTNGKGSTVAYLSKLLQAHGLEVGTFTSPYITRFNERIRLNGRDIPDEILVELVQRLEPVVLRLDQEYDGQGPKEFEVVTMLMFLYFAKVQPDYALVEVGIGGTYDSTNILIPELAVITSVSYDHMQILGDSLTQIATAKAGIIKANKPVVIGKMAEESLAVIEKRAKEMGAPYYRAGLEFNVFQKKRDFLGEVFDYTGLNYVQKSLKTRLLGAYQVENASVALTAFLVLAQNAKIKVYPKEIAHALADTTWPGRTELVLQEPLVMLDGAHNEDGIKRLRQMLKERFATQHIYVIMAILADKQVELMLEQIKSLPNVTLIAVTFEAPRKVADIVALKKKEQIQVEMDWATAFKQVLNEMSVDDMILFTGSLYFIAEVRKYFK